MRKRKYKEPVNIITPQEQATLDYELQLARRALAAFDELPQAVKDIINQSDCGFSNSDIIKIASWCRAGRGEYVTTRLKMQDIAHRRHYDQLYATMIINIKT